MIIYVPKWYKTDLISVLQNITYENLILTSDVICATTIGASVPEKLAIVFPIPICIPAYLKQYKYYKQRSAD